MLIVFFASPLVRGLLTNTVGMIRQVKSYDVYTNGVKNNDIQVYYSKQHWKYKEVTGYYVLKLRRFDSEGMLKYIIIDSSANLVSRPNCTNKECYDEFLGNLYQDEEGSQQIPFSDDMKGFGINPELKFEKNQFHFLLPKGWLNFDSIRVVIN